MALERCAPITRKLKMQLVLAITNLGLNCIMLGMMISSTLVRLDHPEIGYIQYPIAIGVLVAINVVVQFVTLEKRLVGSIRQ